MARKTFTKEVHGQGVPEGFMEVVSLEDEDIINFTTGSDDWIFIGDGRAFNFGDTDRIESTEYNSLKYLLVDDVLAIDSIRERLLEEIDYDPTYYYDVNQGDEVNIYDIETYKLAEFLNDKELLNEIDDSLLEDVEFDFTGFNVYRENGWEFEILEDYEQYWKEEDFNLSDLPELDSRREQSHTERLLDNNGETLLLTTSNYAAGRSTLQAVDYSSFDVRENFIKYEIIKNIIEFDRDFKYFEGCTYSHDGDMSPEVVESFDTLEEAQEKLNEYSTTVEKMKSGIPYHRVTEYYIEANEYDADGMLANFSEIEGVAKRDLDELIAEKSVLIDDLIDNYYDELEDEHDIVFSSEHVENAKRSLKDTMDEVEARMSDDEFINTYKEHIDDSKNLEINNYLQSLYGELEEKKKDLHYAIETTSDSRVSVLNEEISKLEQTINKLEMSIPRSDDVTKSDIDNLYKKKEGLLEDIVEANARKFEDKYNVGFNGQEIDDLIKNVQAQLTDNEVYMTDDDFTDKYNGAIEKLLDDLNNEKNNAMEFLKENIKEGDASINGVLYINSDYEIEAFKNNRYLGRIDKNTDITIEEIKDGRILGMTEESQYTLVDYMELNDIERISDFELIASGIDPILSDWEDGMGNYLAYEGWGDGLSSNRMESLMNSTVDISNLKEELEDKMNPPIPIVLTMNDNTVNVKSEAVDLEGNAKFEVNILVENEDMEDKLKIIGISVINEDMSNLYITDIENAKELDNLDDIDLLLSSDDMLDLDMNGMTYIKDEKAFNTLQELANDLKVINKKIAGLESDIKSIDIKNEKEKAIENHSIKNIKKLKEKISGDVEIKKKDKEIEI